MTIATSTQNGPPDAAGSDSEPLPSPIAGVVVRTAGAVIGSPDVRRVLRAVEAAERATLDDAECDVCGYTGSDLRIAQVVVCRVCDLNWDDIMRGFAEAFDIPPQQCGRRPSALLKELCRAQAGLCGLCGVRLEPWDDIDVDHILPRSLGGGNDRENLQATHARCNQKKGNRVSDETA